jgi:hypothetical protein
MGIVFEVEHANIVAYLTSPRQRPPRIAYGQLSSFLAVLHNEGHQPVGDLFGVANPPRFGSENQNLISSSGDWIERVE